MSTARENLASLRVYGWISWGGVKTGSGGSVITTLVSMSRVKSPIAEMQHKYHNVLEINFERPCRAECRYSVVSEISLPLTPSLAVIIVGIL